MRSPEQQYDSPPNLTDSFKALQAARKQRAYEPYLSHGWGVAYVAVSCLILCYCGLFKLYPILIFFALWMPLPLLKDLRILKPGPDMLLAFSLPTLCLTSSLWSDFPGVTRYLGAAFVALVFCIVIISRTVRFQSFIEGLTLGISTAIFLTLLDGRYTLDGLTGTYALSGLFGSKNAAGFVSQIGVLAAITLLRTSVSLRRRLILAIPCGLMCLIAMLLSKSGTAFLTLLFCIGALMLIYAIYTAPASIRLLFGLLLALVIVTLAIVGFVTDSHALVLDLLGKDTTLTGRTYLWQQGFTIGQERPLWGHGYSGFWVHGQPRAEAFWKEFGIPARGGFHFHNTLVQVFVDLGAVGVALMAWLILYHCVATGKAALRSRMSAEATLLFALSVMFLIRGVVEVDYFVGPFGVGSLLFYFMIPRLAEMRRYAASTDR